MYKKDYRKSNDDENKIRYKSHDFKKRINDRDEGKKIFCLMQTHSFEDEDGGELNEKKFVVYYRREE